MKFLRRIPFQQLSKFIMIGSTAALTNLAGVIFLVSVFHFHPLFANVFAYLAAFCVSFLGHKHWTFAEVNAKNRTAIGRFSMVVLINFLLSESLYYLLLKETTLDYRLALLIVVVAIPPVTFTLSKFWAFREVRQN